MVTPPRVGILFSVERLQAYAMRRFHHQQRARPTLIPTDHHTRPCPAYSEASEQSELGFIAVARFRMLSMWPGRTFAVRRAEQCASGKVSCKTLPAHTAKGSAPTCALAAAKPSLCSTEGPKARLRLGPNERAKVGMAEYKRGLSIRVRLVWINHNTTVVS